MIKNKINEAFNFAQQRHSGQFRKNSNIAYFTHPKYVARIIEKITDDEDLVCVALLHDVIEDTNTTYDEVKNIFGDKIANLVNELTNNSEECGKLKKKDYMVLKFNTISSDALTVKLADRYHNILFLDKDLTSKKAYNFMVYYWKNTKYILDKIDRELNTIQIDLIISIYNLLIRLKYKYKIKEYL